MVEGQTQALFKELIQTDQLVGDVYSISYETALVQIHDHFRRRVGGIPSLSFLIATRVNPDGPIDCAEEDSSIILLRVMDAAPLPNAQEAERIRVEVAQRVSGEPTKNWDDPSEMDPHTNTLLSFAGVKCRVIGTFYVDMLAGGDGNYDRARLFFGSDLSNYYPNRGLKVYKPTARALERIVNFRSPTRADAAGGPQVDLGMVRYASTNRSFQKVSDVTVTFAPADLLAQKSALFGMTRTGKSNTTKIILKSVFELRFDILRPLRAGQVVFDPNGEYANDNWQDAGGNANPTAIKNVWKANPLGKRADVVTYGIFDNPNDPDRRLMRINFFADENLQIGKDIINNLLADTQSIYMRNFRQVAFAPPDDPNDRGRVSRYNRRVLAYRALLATAGLKPAAGMKPSTRNLFNQDLLKVMRDAGSDYLQAANILSKSDPSWDEVGVAMKALYAFIDDKKSGYKEFNDDYMSDPKRSGEAWADDDLKSVLKMFTEPNGTRQLGKVRPQHTDTTRGDYADAIYEDLVAGRLVLIDQSSGDAELNKAAAERVMRKIYQENQDRFRNAERPPDIIVYAEEAHNLLPPGSEEDVANIWAKTAKEGAKLRIGFVYATQEVSSIQRNILKATANWFISHLNNTDETKELCKYYDFADFEASIRRAQDSGFVRVKTLSNMFVIPVQIHKFEV